MPEEITSQIKRLAPLLEEDSEVFRELTTFFSPDAKINMHRDDLSKFLQDNRTYQVVRVSGKSYKVEVSDMVDAARNPVNFEYTVNFFSYEDEVEIDGATYTADAYGRLTRTSAKSTCRTSPRCSALLRK